MMMHNGFARWRLPQETDHSACTQPACAGEDWCITHPIGQRCTDDQATIHLKAKSEKLISITSYRAMGRELFYTPESPRALGKGVRAMGCTSCGGELILTNVVPEKSATAFEHHTFICPACRITASRVVLMRHGREEDPKPLQIYLTA
jgi:hypothetical protein